MDLEEDYVILTKLPQRGEKQSARRREQRFERFSGGHGVDALRCKLREVV
jgi:hypothetical protein